MENESIGTKVNLIFSKNLGKYENANLCRRYQIYIYEGADALRCFCGCSQAAGLENDDDMWGINPLTRLASHCSLCVASNGKAGGVKANIYFGDRRRTATEAKYSMMKNRCCPDHKAFPMKNASFS